MCASSKPFSKPPCQLPVPGGGGVRRRGLAASACIKRLPTRAHRQQSRQKTKYSARRLCVGAAAAPASWVQTGGLQSQRGRAHRQRLQLQATSNAVRCALLDMRAASAPASWARTGGLHASAATQRAAYSVAGQGCLIRATRAGLAPAAAILARRASLDASVASAPAGGEGDGLATK